MAFMEANLSNGPVLLSLVYIALTYLITTAIYRLYLSPLAKFPGPKLAALTLWYEFYYDVVKRGKYTWRIAEMHKQYGTQTASTCLPYFSADQYFRTNCTDQSI